MKGKQSGFVSPPVFLHPADITPTAMIAMAKLKIAVLFIFESNIFL
jgi:hypothetical protein